ncbi:MAG TPA: beta-propeller fold lactonase family protein, partial [Polyangiaceae bacterium]
MRIRKLVAMVGAFLELCGCGGRVGDTKRGKTDRVLYVTNIGNDTVSVVSVPAEGDSFSLTSFGSRTGLSGPGGIAVDGMNQEIVVANAHNDSITVYARTDSGNIAPVRTIVGPSTGLGSPTGIAVDSVNDEVVVANEGWTSILVFSRTASGDVMPLRTISGSSTNLREPTDLA